MKLMERIVKRSGGGKRAPGVVLLVSARTDGNETNLLRKQTRRILLQTQLGPITVILTGLLRDTGIVGSLHRYIPERAQTQVTERKRGKSRSSLSATAM